jgi:hypothetical protein
LPAGYVTANRSTWKHIIKARSGGIAGAFAIDNLVIQNTQTLPATNTYLTPVSSSGTNGCVSATTPVVLNVGTAPTVTATPATSSVCTGANVTLVGGGATTYSWTGGITNNTPFVAATGTTTYTVTGTDGIGCTNTATADVIAAPCATTVNLTLFIEGYYAGSSTMTPVKANEGIGSSTTIVDDITVELRDPLATIPYDVVATTTAVLHTGGTATATFTPAISGSYMIAVKHRNAIETWSAGTVAVGTTPASYNFSSASTQAYGGNMFEIEPGVWAFFSGDNISDGNVDGSDYTDWETESNNFSSGYFASDLNGDGNVDGSDYTIWETNANNFVSSIHP